MTLPARQLDFPEWPKFSCEQRAALAPGWGGMHGLSQDLPSCSCSEGVQQHYNTGAEQCCRVAATLMHNCSRQKCDCEEADGYWLDIAGTVNCTQTNNAYCMKIE